MSSTTPLVSVIIPCYNHGSYLPEAFESIYSQQFPDVEIVVVDDGSKDNTREITSKYPDVKYIYQTNQGLSAARNTGIKSSSGSFLIFLDADDWLLPNAIATNYACLSKNQSVAFVSGGHEKVYEDLNTKKDFTAEITDNHYCHLLQGNYIGMHAAVMYRRSVFNEFLFDISLKACEDYDLYLKISRKYRVHHHTKKIAAYRIHNSNMSGNIRMMLSTVLSVLGRQKPHLQNDLEKQAFKNGQEVWKHYYTNELYQKLLIDKNSYSPEHFFTLYKYNPALSLKYFKTNPKQVLKSIIKKNAPAFILKGLHSLGVTKAFIPEVGRVNKGDFKRKSPFSTEFGYDRGGPVDRYYIESFLMKESLAIKGRVMEIGDNEYTLKYGKEGISKSDVLHVHEGNPKATLIGDISNAPQIPDNTFDCIILTQTLHLIYDYKEALQTCHRILKPGGALLLTVPGITPIDHGEWKETWYWSFTDKAMRRLMDETFPGGAIEINSYGNVYIATAFLYGMGINEVSTKELGHQDPHFQVINTVKAIKGNSI